MSRKLRKADVGDVEALETALVHLKAARKLVRVGGARKTHKKIYSAIKSLQGAINHALRAATRENILDMQRKTECVNVWRDRGAQP